MRRFLLAFGLVALLVAGALSYLADQDPDGLDAATQRGCTVAADGTLTGDCVARDASEHPLAGGPLAGYTVGGDDGLTGVAGVLGVLVTLGAAGGLFWLLARRRPAPGRAGQPGGLGRSGGSAPARWLDRLRRR